MSSLPLQDRVSLIHLNATLTNHLTSVDSKQLTTNLNPPESTLTKSRGRGGVMVNQIFDKEICPACPESRREEHRDEGSLSKSDKNMPVVAQA